VSDGPWDVLIETDLGGLFYLVNLALYLELYGDFSRPREPGLLLSPWDLVALLGRALLGATASRGSAEDPIWALLARLAGRDPTATPGEGFSPPGEWRVPPRWLRPLDPPGPLRWSAGARLVVEHAAGFAVLDVARQGGPEEQLTNELAAYPPSLRDAARVRGHHPPVAPHSPLSRWLSWLVPYVRARLLRALGLDPPCELAPILLRHRALVRATDTRVDVELRLQDLPVAVRLAGLDRDPGWIPAAGRKIAFDFR
jgi:hypothetical protein